ncbi:MAG: homoserine kinase [Saprospiraceae bacterium]
MSKSGIKVFAPATVANVAVGFDILGFALEKPGDEIIVREGKEKGLVINDIRGAQGRLPYEVHKNTAGYAAYKFLQFLGEADRPIEMEIHKKMPFGSGLGSSAASAVGGVFAVNELLRAGLSKNELLQFAVDGEQLASGARHADNVAPSLLGGMVLIRDNDTIDVKKLYIPHGLCAVVLYPHVEVLTKESRGILSPTVDFKTSIRQSGNLASFVAAMYTSDFDMIRRSLKDLVVEPQRAHLIPYFYEMQAMAMEVGALGFSISGAGPSMFGLCDNTSIAETIAQRAETWFVDKKVGLNSYISPINQEGAILY